MDEHRLCSCWSSCYACSYNFLRLLTGRPIYGYTLLALFTIKRHTCLPDRQVPERLQYVTYYLQNPTFPSFMMMLLYYRRVRKGFERGVRQCMVRYLHRARFRHHYRRYSLSIRRRKTIYPHYLVDASPVYCSQLLC